ncbi:F-box protein At5g49610-like [Triticum dicoccoides]|uniref:F-box protein At5g49610-like n=1 Tax=Triticum dicoccoides TaxID=85692 RepID=UPI00188E221C|nr:F-box protein At5g49610-like [Triticum dicoccoides]
MFERNTKSRMESHPGLTSGAAGLLTDDLILEIFSRLPARSLHRFKCVSVSWRDLITDPANRNKLSQTLAGFLYTSPGGRDHHFASVSGDGAAPFDLSLPYLRNDKDDKGITLVDACNGLLLCRRHKKNKATPWKEDDFGFVMCNPVTGRWVELPSQPQAPPRRYTHTVGLAFDSAVSSHFHVLHFEETYTGSYITGVNIYSSRTRAWSHRDISGMVDKVTLFSRSKCVFAGGMMYLMGNLEEMNGEYVLVGVDMEGKVWKTIRTPYGRRFGMIGLSQGCLHYLVASVDNYDAIQVSEIALWCLKDRDSKELVLKHTANINKLMSMTEKMYMVAEIHPDCDTIFLVSFGGDTLAAYDMRHQKVGCILNLEKNTRWFLPYVPLLSESLAGEDCR